MKRSSILFTLILLLGGFSLRAQAVKTQMIQDWERARAYTEEYLKAMPEAGYAFKPTPEIRSFAEQMLHIADANYGFTAAASGKAGPLERGGAEKSAKGQSKEETVKMVLDSYDFVLQALKEMKDDALMQTMEFAGQTMTKATTFAKAFEHQTHHRGQATIYLRLKGVTPPQERLF